MRRLKIDETDIIKLYNRDTPNKFVKKITINLPKSDYGTIAFDNTTKKTSFYVNDIVIREIPGDFFDKFNKSYIQATYSLYYSDK